MLMVTPPRSEIERNALAIAAEEEQRAYWRRLQAQDALRRWYLLQIQPQHEHIVSGHLIGLRLKVYNPMLPVDRPVWSRNVLTGVRFISGRKRVLRPMFPGYLFVRIDFDAEWPKVRARAGVERVATLDHPDGRPYVIHDEVVGDIHAKEQELLRERAKKSHDFKPGQVVEISHGPFFGFLAEIERLEDGERIRLLLDLFGRKTPVVVEPHEIEAVGRKA